MMTQFMVFQDCFTEDKVPIWTLAPLPVGWYTPRLNLKTHPHTFSDFYVQETEVHERRPKHPRL